MDKTVIKRKPQTEQKYIYKFVKWAYGNEYAIIDQFYENMTPVRRFVGKASFYEDITFDEKSTQLMKNPPN